MTPHVIVVGGGIAGLVMARELAEGGVRVTLFEASGRLGGKLRPHTVGGIELDAGAESFATRGGTVAALATDLGLGGSIVTPSDAGAWLMSATGTALPLPRAGLLGVPSIPLARDVIAIVGIAGALRAQLDALMLGFVGSNERSLGLLVRKRMGRAVLDRLVAPVATAIHSAHPDDLDVDVVAPRLRAAVLSEGSLAKAVLTLRAAAPAGAAVQGVDGGVFRLVDAIVEDLTARTESSVHIVLRGDVAEADDAGVTLADGSRHPADRVVLATETGRMAGQEMEAAPGDPIILATIVVASSPQLDAAPRGTGVLVAAGAPGVRAKALTHATAKWDWLALAAGGRHVLRLSYSRAPENDAELQEWARTDAELLLGVPIPATSVLAFDRQEWTGPVAARLGERRPAPRSEAGAGTSVVHIGERVAGTGLAAVIAHSRRQAGSLLRDLGGQAALGLKNL